MQVKEKDIKRIVIPQGKAAYRITICDKLGNCGQDDFYQADHVALIAELLKKKVLRGKHGTDES